MSLTELLKTLKANQIEIQEAGGKLKTTAPKGAITQELASRIKANKQALLDFVARKKSQRHKAVLQQIGPAPQAKDYPLSFAQQRLWFIERMEGHTSKHNMPTAFRMRGRLDLEALRRAFGTLVERHQVLRTNFVESEGEPRQLVGEARGVPIETVNLRGMAEADRDHAVQNWIAEEAHRPFDLGRDLMVRCRVLELGKDDHVVLFTMHHIASDGWSLNVLVKEVAELYNAYAHGKVPELSPLPVQYVDFAYWERNLFKGGVLEEALDYWRQKLSGSPSVHSLPLDKPRPPKQRFKGKFFTNEAITGTLFEDLKALCQREDVTLYMLLQTAFSVLLSRYSNETDILLASPAAGRANQALAPLIGFFVNSLVFRTDLRGNPGFRELLSTNKRHILETYSHQNLPFEMVVEALKPERSLSHSPIFQIMFALQNNERQELKMASLELERLGLEGDINRFDLELSITEYPNGLVANWAYNTDIFHEETIRRMSGNFEVLLASIAANPSGRVQQLPLLSEAERGFLAQGNVLAEGAPAHLKCVHQQVASWAEKHPNRIAVSHGPETLSYGALDRKAGGLAHRLLALGMRHGDFVGVYLERSPAMMVSILAILKAGGVYVPLDPEYPASRIAFMASDAEIGTVLTCRELAGGFPLQNLQLVCLDEAGLPDGEAPPVGVTVTPGDLAYVIYTSGSTGQPKGVLIEHGQWAHCLASVGETLGFGEEDSLTQIASPAFDIALLEQFLPLIRGGKTIAVDREDLFDMARLVAATHETTFFHAVPSLMTQWLETLASDSTLPDYGRLRTLLVGGEATPGHLLDTMAAAFPGVGIVELYGPTENTIVSTFHQKREPRETVNHCIGRKFPHVKTLVLSPAGELAPWGAVGELHLGGMSVARGYLKRPGLTAEKFVENPFEGCPGDRLYRTGDLVRWLPDGDLEFMGRADHQIKIRGFRIELEEIETQIAKHPLVETALVSVFGEQDDDQRLVAYIRPTRAALEDAAGNPGSGVDAGPAIEATWVQTLTQGLKKSLAKHLPKYMVPAFYVYLREFPLTPNGKIDRDRLPAPEPAKAEAYSPPTSETQTKLQHIWQELLGIWDIGIDADFFELGGHSLLAIRMISAVRAAFDCDLPVRAVFEQPTIEGIAAYLEGSERSRMPALRKYPEKESVPLSFAQQRLWFIDQFEGGSPHYNMPGQFKLEGMLDPAGFRRAVEAVAMRHRILRTVYTALGGVARQIVREDLRVPLTLVDVSHLAPSVRDRQLRSLAIWDSGHPFDLTKDAMLRVMLVRLAPETHVVSFNMHHIASDGWSVGVLVNEIATLYASFSAGEAIALPPLPIQYADFAQWQRSWLQGAALEHQLSYWRDNLAGLPQAHDLPLDKPRPAHQTFAGQLHTTGLDVNRSEALRTFARAQGATLFMVLETAFAALLSRLSGETDIVVGTPIAGRTLREVEPLIGFFVNSLVLRSKIDPERSFAELLARNKQQILDAYTHQHVPFEMLVESLNPDRSMSHSPIFQIMFSLQNEDDSEIRLPGLRLAPMPQPHHTIRFDLELSVKETANGLSMGWFFNESLFERQSIEHYAACFQQWLSAILSQPTDRIEALELLPGIARKQLLDAGRLPAAHPQEPTTVTALFEAQAAKTPNAAAVVFEGQTLSYRMLDLRANRVANQLVALGVGPDSKVGLFLARGPEFVIGMLAVLKAGGAFVPLDPDYPVARVNFMAADSGMDVLLTQTELAERSPEVLETLCLDNPAAFENAPADAPAAVHRGDQLAYVVYTSGSLGQPKGVMMEMGSLTHHLLRIIDAYRIGAEDRVLQFTNTGFDPAIEQTFTALLTGARLYLRPPVLWQPGAFNAWLAEKGITSINIPPGYAAVVLPALFEDEPFWHGAALRQILIGGEAFPPGILESWRKHGISGQCRLVNVYGPTESCITSHIYTLPVAGEVPAPLPIGSFVDGTGCYVLDRAGHLVPQGVIGELHIGGPRLARGYLNRPHLTAEKFISNPWIPGERLYRTGDLVRCLADGQLQFCGRLDVQIKHRGFRIEPGEIENRLCQHEDVAQAHVVLRDDDSGKYLTAYLVLTHPEAAFNADELKPWLKRSLPDYMVPAAFVTLPELPLTANGKVDEAALPKPEYQSSAGYAPPRNGIEKTLVTVWEHILKIDQVGIHDNFFALGGDSILSIQIVAEAALAGLEMTTKALFENQTIAELAGQVTKTEGTQRSQEPVTGPMPLLPIMRKFLNEGRDKHHFNQSLLLEVPAGFDREILQDLVTALYRRHDALRLRFTGVNGTWQANHEPLSEAMVAESCVLETLPETAKDRSAFIAARCDHWQRGFDLAKGPLMRAVYFVADKNPAGQGTERLFLVAHHLVVDGVSWRILLADLERAFEQARSGRGIQLPPKTSSFQQWGQALVQSANETAFVMEKPYWLSQMKPPVSQYPRDHATDDLGTRAASRAISIQLTPVETKALLQKCNGAYRTAINELLLAGTYLGMRAWSGDAWLRLGLESHGREGLPGHLDVTQTIGWFTAIYPLALYSEHDDPGSVICGVKEQYRAIPNHGLGYGVLRYLAGDPELATKESQSNLAFNYLGQFDQTFTETSPFRMANESKGEEVSPESAREYELELTSMVAGGVWRASLIYSSGQYNEATMARLGDAIRDGMKRVIDHCLQPGAGRYTPSDFPLALADQQQLDTWQQRYNIARLYPATPMQAGMVFHSLMDSAAYTNQTYPVLKGGLDTALFRQAWQLELERHDVFRTAIVGEGEALHQLVVPDATMPWHEEDWRELDEAAQSARFEAFRLQDKCAGFTFDQAPLMRLAIFRLEDEKYQVLWTVHHCLVDGWCLPLVYKEVMVIYNALSKGTPIPLEPAAVYEQYIAWLQNQELDSARAYWRRMLADVDAATAFSVDKLPSGGHSGYREQIMDFTVVETSRLREAAKTQKTTMNNLLMLAWGYLLHRYSGDARVVFGTAISGRPAAVRGVGEMVGLFVNTIPVTLTFDRQEPLGAILEALGQTLPKSQEMGFLSLMEIQKQSGVPTGRPLFESVLALDNYPMEALTDGSTDTTDLKVESSGSDEQSNFKLAINVSLKRLLSIKVTYRGEDFADAPMVRLLGHLKNILTQLPEAFEQNVTALEMLTPPEHAQIRAWNQTGREFEQHRSMRSFFEEAASNAPEALAVLHGEATITYGDLNAEANRIAHYLVDHGAKPGAVVAIFTERSIEAILAMVAVVKSGAAFLPISTKDPEERIAMMLEEAEVDLVLTENTILESYPLLSDYTMLPLDSEYRDLLLGAYSQENPDPKLVPANPEDLAYVIYTSGSTGVPKGVACHQKGLANLCFWHQREFEVGRHSRGTLMANLNFDACIWETWPYLLANAGVVIVPDEVRTQPEKLRTLFHRFKMTHCFLTTGLFESMAHTGLFKDCGLKYLLTGGDRLSAYRLDLDPGTTLINNYGPTEVTAITSCCRLAASAADAPPIGKPIDNLQVHVLSPGMEVQPVGVAGELYVGGIGVSRGYLNQPERTREVFVADPFHPGETLYKTGDLVRRLESGDLAFISRVDGQVKLRGFRIETGEIEVKLNALGFVTDAVVLVRGDQGEKRIVAYVVVKDDRDKLLIRNDLKQRLQQQMPDYMVPSAFVILDALPLTSNGKIDRDALPEPDYQAGQSYTAPRTAAEKALAEIWQKVLRIPQVGIHDNFFEIGGDSILSIQIASRAKMVGLNVTTKALFQHQTIAEVAVHCGEIDKVEMPQEAVTGTMPLLPVQARFLTENIFPHHYNQSVLLIAPDDFHRDDLSPLLTALYVRHDALRLRFDRDDEVWTAVHKSFVQSMVMGSSVVELLPEDPDAHSAFISERCNYWQGRFDLTAGPLLRMVLFTGSGGESSQQDRILIVMHHIVVDGVSWRILLADLEEAYAKLRAGEPVTLAPKTSSFKQWGEALAEYAKSDALAAEKDYWLAQARIDVPDLPVDKTAPGACTVSTSRGVSFGLNEADTQALLQKCHGAYHTTINELLLAGLFLGMREWTGASALSLLLEGHGREALFDHLDTTQTLGWFTAVYPLALTCGNDRPGEVIKAIKEQYRGIPNNGIGYGVLRYLRKDPEISEAWQTPVLIFNYLGQFDQTINEESQFKAAPENSGNEVSADEIRHHQLGFNGKVFAGKLQFTINYSHAQYHRETMEALAALVEDGLKRVIHHCLEPDAGSYTPSDFPLARIQQTQLDQWQFEFPEIARLYPATPMQAGMLFHSLLDRSAYATQTYPVLKGTLDPGHFREAWSRVVQRYDAFRTIFAGEGEALHQLVLPHASLKIHEEDWRRLPDAEQQEKFEAFRSADKRAGFDFRKAPLMRLALFRLDEDRYQLLWTLHHIVADGWSFPHIYREVIAIYHALSAGREPALKPPAIYENYIAWLMRQNVDEAKAFWRDLLKDVEAPTPLVVDNSGRDDEPGFGERYLTLDAAEAKALQTVAASNQTTVNTLLQLAWSYLLHRYSGEPHTVFGTAITGRPSEVERVEEMVGLFINTIPVKVSFDDRSTVLEQIEALNRTFQESMEKGYLSLVEITRQSKVPGGTPLFDSALALNNYPLEDVVETPKTTTDLHIEQVGNDEQTTYKLTLVAGLSDKLQIWCSYRHRDFSDEAIARMLGHLGQILRQLPSSLDRSIQTIDILTEGEKQALASWNQTGTSYPKDLCLHELFEIQAERTPEATALVFQGQEIQFAALNEKANRLAHYLVSKGVKPDGFVGLSVTRSVEMIVGMLGIMKAGGAYVPIDPELPEERIRFILDDSGIDLVLTQTHLLQSHPVLADLNHFALDAESENAALADLAGTNLDKRSLGLTASNLIYLIYTSGTTGQPKGVMIEHTGFTNVVLAQIELLEVRPESRLIQFASLSFDASITEIAISLVAGAALCIPTAEVLKSPSALTAFKHENRLTHVTLPPAFLPLLDPDDFRDVKHFKVAGDACPMDQVRAWSKGRNFYNGYGPTEVSVGLSVSNYHGGSRLTIGRPMANKYSYVVDARNRLQPVGIPGEILIGGVGLARGYLNRPELTAEKFVEDPIAKVPGQKVYRTGDIARYLADGEMVFQGRLDDQVKVRGFRVELGEIEAQLRAVEGVKDALVLARDGADGEKQLVAYLVTSPDQELELWPSVSEWHVLDDVLYRSMLENTARVEGYTRAFHRALANQTVLEIGPGSELALTKLCLEAGAAHVYAVEIDEEAYLKAKAAVSRLGLEDRVTLIHGDARSLNLPEKVDYCVSALVGAIGGSEGAGPILNDVRDQLKQPEHMIPQRAITKMAALELPPQPLGFGDIAAHYVKAIFEEVGAPFDLRVCLKNITKEALLSSTGVLEDLDFRQEVPEQSKHNVQLDIHRKGTIHGLLAWLTFDIDAAESIDILEDNEGWLPVFLPISQEGLAVAPGDKIRGQVSRQTHVQNLQTDFVIDLELVRQSGEVRPIQVRAEHQANHFRANAFYREWFAEDGSVSKHHQPLEARMTGALKRKLPYYMMPSAFVRLDAFPLTANGKIDKKALPAPDFQANGEFIAAETETEKTLAQIWEKVLKLERVGVTQNFFALGGHSLLATQMIGEVKHRFQLDIPLQEIFDRQNIRALAEAIDQLSHQRTLRDDVLLEASDQEDEELIEI